MPGSELILFAKIPVARLVERPFIFSVSVGVKIDHTGRIASGGWFDEKRGAGDGGVSFKRETDGPVGARRNRDRLFSET